MGLQLIVCGCSSQKMTIDVCKDEEELKTVTVLDLKRKIAQRLPGNQEEAVAEMELIFAGVRLKEDHTTLSSHGLVHKSIVQIVVTLDRGMSA